MFVNLERKINSKDASMFFGASLGPANFVSPKYPQIDKIVESMKANDWEPESISLQEDIASFNNLSENERFIFSSVLARQVLLDSIQQVAPEKVIGACSSLHEIRRLTQVWSYFETIHSNSYSYVIRTVYPNPDEVFDKLYDNEFIKNCNDTSSKYYAKLYYKDGYCVENMMLCLFSVHALEAIRFYTSFAVSFAFEENGKMKKNAKIIELIMRDENLHKNVSKLLIQLYMKECQEAKDFFLNNQDKIYSIYEEVIEEEKLFIDYLFKDGSLKGLNSNMLKEYLEYISNAAMKSVKLEKTYSSVKTNPLIYMERKVNASKSQAAPQEEEITSYKRNNIVGEIDLENLNKSYKF